MSVFRRNDPARPRTVRGNVLWLMYMAMHGDPLNPDDPAVMGRQLLVQTLEHLKMLPATAELNNAIRYLEAKGYVDAEWENDGTGDLKSVRLLPTGMDLVELSTTDPGVTFVRRR
jgi:hypothetical protein